jgi:hypothetical protein
MSHVKMSAAVTVCVPLMAPPVLTLALVAMLATDDKTLVAVPVLRSTLFKSTSTAATDGSFAGSQSTRNAVIVPATGMGTTPFFAPDAIDCPLPDRATCKYTFSGNGRI